MPLPDLNLLLALDVLIDECSVAAAARRMNLSAPAMSRTLGRIIREQAGIFRKNKRHNHGHGTGGSRYLCGCTAKQCSKKADKDCPVKACNGSSP